MSRQQAPAIPQARQQTERQRLFDLLLDAEPQDAKALSGAAHISEKDVYNHLIHIEKSVRKDDRRLIIVVAECRGCGFALTKQGKFGKPGRCPDCKGERIMPPLYHVE